MTQLLLLFSKTTTLIQFQDCKTDARKKTFLKVQLLFVALVDGNGISDVIAQTCERFENFNFFIKTKFLHSLWIKLSRRIGDRIGDI